MALTTVVVAYDIVRDDHRSAVAALLQAYGDRIQKSVFALTVTTDELAEIRARAGQRIDPTTDSVYLFTFCGACWQRIDLLGQADPPREELCWTVL